MSYDINLIDRKTKETIKVSAPFLMRGGTVPAELGTDGRLHQATQRDAHINITYNYASYYHEATDGDMRFYPEGEKTSAGIRGLYGKTPLESIPMITDMIERIQEKYKNQDGTWKIGKRTKKEYTNSRGEKLPFDTVLTMVLKNTPEAKNIQEKTVEYEVSEGDTSNYWEKTASNAILPLQEMLHIATECISRDYIWDGD